MKILAALLRLGPLFFGIGFLAPVLAAAMRAGGADAPLGLDPLTLGLIAGGVLGATATVRRRWI